MSPGAFVERHELVGGFSRELLDDALETLRRNGVKSVLVSMCDGSGVSRVKAIAAETFEQAALDGVPYQSGVLSLDSGGAFVSGTGFDFDLAGQCFLLLPDPASLMVTPWHPGTALVMADPYFVDGRPVEAAPRLTLRRALAGLEARGLAVTWGWEFEFYTFRRGEDGALLPTTPDMQALHQVRHRQSTPLLEAITTQLEAAGVPVTDVIQEYGPGQLEVNFGPGAGLGAVDRAFAFRHAVKEIAATLGVVASFMTKPLAGSPASACHLHGSLTDRAGANVFHDPADPDGISETLRAWIHGHVRHAPALTALCVQTVNGYKRFTPNSFAPANVSWGFDNRTTMLRIPLSRGPGTRLENRLPEAATNPYVAAAGSIVAGQLGLDAGPGAPHFVGGNAYLESLPPLPSTLSAALVALEADEAVRSRLGEPFIRLYTAIKRHEIRRFLEAVTDWERHEYLELA
jgi:glutamine synthetase